ncbi:MAG: PIN domain-containing protein [Bryobacteraceae bacterium]|nr:PIN domain-containing protein [Bryobacteraceae bacterium]
MGRLHPVSEEPKEATGQGQGGVSGITLDAGALIAVDRDHRRVIALLARAAERGARITIPATALAQAIRNPARQVRLTRLIRHVLTDVAPLHGPDATAVGILLARTGTSDVVDAHVVVCARRTGQPLLTSDPGDLRRIGPELRLLPV